MEELLSICQFIDELKMNSIKIEVPEILRMIKEDEIDFQQVITLTEYKIYKYEVERLVAAQHLTTIENN